MPRTAKPLSAREVATIKKPGVHFDGNGLALRVGPTGAKSWIFRYVGSDGRRHDLGLGPVHTVSLAEARDLALSCRKQRLGGDDPLEAKHAARLQRRVAAAKTLTFGEAAEAYIEAHRPGWRDPRAAPQWRSSLRDYVLPVFGGLPVDAVDVALVLRAVEPIWSTKAETASRVRNRIESVLDWATARGYRQGDNPARWRGHLENVLPKKSKVARVAHHPALPYQEISRFMVDLRQQQGIAAVALEFIVLTACRVGEVIGAAWHELDLEAKIWTIPAERMKAAAPHRVPLSQPALAIIEKMAAMRQGDHLFPGINPDRPISASAIRLVIDRIGGGATTHGMRACFRSWCADHGIARDLAEQSLAHKIGNAVEQAYNRTDLLERRRTVMGAWAAFCGPPAPAAQVVALRGSRQ